MSHTLRRGLVDRTVFEAKQTSVAYLALPVTGCETLDRLLNTPLPSVSGSNSIYPHRAVVKINKDVSCHIIE